MPVCARSTPGTRPETTARPAADYSAAAGKIAQRTRVSRRSVIHGAVILLITVMVRSMLLHLQGHEARSHADLTDRDRDESSRRAISAWVRTNPQTQVRMRSAATVPRFLLELEAGVRVRGRDG